VTGAVYDSGALIGAESNKRDVWRLHKAALSRGVTPIVPATVLAQVVRGPSTDANLRRLLKGCRTEPLDEDDAEAIGVLMVAAGTSDIVDGHVIVRVLATGAAVLSGDRRDLERLAGAVNRTIQIIDV
jgi:hypothetical protein